MKTSNMLLLTTLLITLGCLTAYNYKLKEVYSTREYRNEFSGMTFKPLKGVEKLIVNSANLLNIEVKQSNKEGVWIQNNLKDDLKLTVSNQSLTIDMNAERQSLEKGVVTGSKIIILTKELNSINTIPSVNKGKTIRSSIYGSMDVKNYKIDQLDLLVSPDLTVKLDHMQINKLNATVGTQTGESGQLIVFSDNQINTAKFDVPGNGGLQLINPKIIKTSYNLSERASVSLDGKVVSQLRSAD